jgi:hypothetical protein
VRTKVVRFSALVARSRWKVEYFCSEGTTATNALYPTVLLKDVLQERRESLNPQSHPDHTFNYLGLEHVQSVTGDLVDYRPRHGREVLSRSKVFRGGDVLYGRLRPSLNKVFVADDSLPEGICSSEFYVFIPDPERLRPHFARALLASRYVQDVVGAMTTGSALPRLHIEDLFAITIPLPPLDEQHQVEEHLLEQKRRRGQIAHELAVGPESTLSALVAMLEVGVPFALPEAQFEGGEDFSRHRLPPEPPRRA